MSRRCASSLSCLSCWSPQLYEAWLIPRLSVAAASIEHKQDAHRCLPLSLNCSERAAVSLTSWGISELSVCLSHEAHMAVLLEVGNLHSISSQGLKPIRLYLMDF